MRLNAFRIKNFRSIVDTNFRDLSPDGISLIVGQNESGKSSILEALNCFEIGEITEDDVRSSADMPEVSCVFKFDNFTELTDLIPEEKLPKGFSKIFKKLNNCITLTRIWDSDNYDDGNLVIENDDLRSLWEIKQEEPPVVSPQENAGTPNTEPPVVNEAPAEPKPIILSEDEFTTELFSYLPVMDIFEDNSLLPPTIDLEDLITKNTKANGYEGAKNFLLIADIKVEELKNQSNIRITGDMIENKCKKYIKNIKKMMSLCFFRFTTKFYSKLKII